MFAYRTTAMGLLACALALSGCGGGGGKGGKPRPANLDVEPNSFDEPVELAKLSNLTGEVSSADDEEDVYLFTAPKTARYTFKLSGFGNHDLDLIVADADGTKLVSASDDLVEGETGSADLLKDSPYAMIVLAYQTSSETAKYLLEVREEPAAKPPAEAPPAAGGDGADEGSGGSGACPWKNECYYKWQPPPQLGYLHCDLVPNC